MVYHARKYDCGKLCSRTMKEISICIPTYKRRKYIEQTLAPMIQEISTHNLEDQFEIVIFNDNGADETDTYLRQIVKKYRFITYVMQKKRLGLRKAIEMVPELAVGRYIWFFSDDDIPTEGSLLYISRLLQEKKPGIVFGNVDDFDGKRVLHENMLGTDRDMILYNRKEFFRFLGTKFGSITYFTSYISNFIIKKELYDANSIVNEKYDSSLNMTPLVTPFFYTRLECPVIVTKRSVVLRRTDNESWIDPDPVAHTVHAYRISGFHFGNIQFLNMWDIPVKLHLYFFAHILERTMISFVIRIPFGLQVVRIYWRIEKMIYAAVFKRK